MKRDSSYPADAATIYTMLSETRKKMRAHSISPQNAKMPKANTSPPSLNLIYLPHQSEHLVPLMTQMEPHLSPHQVQLAFSRA